ncbi:MAG: nucleotidyltransferase family protein [Candidatus Bathyarchaeota archaeon]|nr:nucleotidyltransferase family protein [Candidatus Bathyarchaeota archaeon]
MGGVRGIVLCGGPGKRLRPITYYFQKAMIPIGRMQKPLLEYIVRLLKFYDIKNLVFLVDYKAEQIVNYFDNGSRFEVSISYVYDDPSLKGTAGSIVNAYRGGVLNTDETLLIYYGDILTDMNLQNFLNFHREKDAVATVALSSGFTVRVGVAELEADGKIKSFQEKPKIDKPVSIAITALEGEALKEMDKMAIGKTDLDLMGDVIPHLIDKGAKVYGYVTDAFWYDVGSTEAYEKLEPDLVDRIFAFLYK